MKNNCLVLCFIYLLIGAFNIAEATQTVFNVPSADVTPKGKIYLLQESQFRAWNPDAFWVGTEYADYGVGHNTEVGVILFNVGAPTTGNIALSTGFKSAMPIAKLKDKYPAREYKFTVGSSVLTSLEGQGVGSWTYAHLSGRLPVTKTRLTAGLSYGTKQVFGTDNLSFIAAVEQPVTKKLNIIADWYSGTEHFAGFLISGFSYALPKDKTIYVGYQIPNTSQNGSSGFVVQMSKIF